jgi:hypothetical protein
MDFQTFATTFGLSGVALGVAFVVVKRLIAKGYGIKIDFGPRR